MRTVFEKKITTYKGYPGRDRTIKIKFAGEIEDFRPLHDWIVGKITGYEAGYEDDILMDITELRQLLRSLCEIKVNNSRADEFIPALLYNEKYFENVESAIVIIEDLIEWLNSKETKRDKDGHAVKFYEICYRGERGK